MTQHIDEARKLEPEWRYEIKYGPEGEANYAWLYRGDEMVATMKTHHAVSLSADLAAAEERGRIDERERCVAVFDLLLRQLVELDKFNRSYALRLTSLAKADCAAITKEPTP